MPVFHKPRPGDVVTVSYDPKLIRAKDKQDRATRAEALLNGAPVPAAAGVVHHVIDDEPRWKVPATCPECGARVDQSTA